MSALSRVGNVEHLDGYVLRVTFSDGHYPAVRRWSVASIGFAQPG
jgi:hypothetical protein